MPLDRLHPDDLPENQPDNAIDGFARKLRAYVAGFQPEMFILSEHHRLSEFTRALNEQLREMHQPIRIEEADLKPILNGVEGPKSMLLVDAMHQALRIYGDEREIFRTAGAKAVQEELQRPSQEAQKNAHLRARNPKGQEDKPSFQEMLEVSNANQENFNQFLFDRLLPSWGLNQVQFCEHLATLNANNDQGKATITDTVLSNWHLGKATPLRDSIDVLTRAFGIKPEANESMAKHERMLWKSIQRLSKYDATERNKPPFEAVLEDAKDSGNHGKLVTRLMDDSGVRYERLKNLLDTHQIPQWKKGARIEDIDTARKFIDIVRPIDDQQNKEEAAKVNREILSLLTGREFDFTQILSQAKEQGNPGGALFGALTGRNGMVTLRPQELINHFQQQKLELTERRVRKMRNSLNVPRGGRISEEEADAILSLVTQRIQPLVDDGIVEPMTDAQKKDMIDTLTGVTHPKDMLKAVVKGEMPIGEMVAKTCLRRNIAQSQAEESFAAEVGLSHLSKFITGKANLEPESAAKIAEWYKKNYQFTPTEQRQLVALARGVQLEKNANDILDDVLSGALPRTQGLREIYDRSGLSRPELANQAGVEYHAIQYSTTEVSGGRIILPEDAIKKIGKRCGISSNRLDDFSDTYSGLKVARKSIKPEDMKKEPRSLVERPEKPASWSQRAEEEDRQTGWSRKSGGS